MGDLKLDPELVRVSEEVDETLLEWFCSLSLKERLRACTQFSRTLGAFKRVDP